MDPPCTPNTRTRKTIIAADGTRTGASAPATPPRSAAPRAGSLARTCVARPAGCAAKHQTACVQSSVSRRWVRRAVPFRTSACQKRRHRYYYSECHEYSRVLAVLASLRRIAAHSCCSLVHLPSEAGTVATFVLEMTLHRAQLASGARQRIGRILHSGALSRLHAAALTAGREDPRVTTMGHGSSSRWLSQAVTEFAEALPTARAQAQPVTLEQFPAA